MTVKRQTAWANCRVGEISDLVRGVSYAKSEASKEAKPGYSKLLRANNINVSVNFDDLVYVKDERVSSEQRLADGDVIIAMSSGSKSLVGKAAQIWSSKGSTIGAFCSALHPVHGINAKYFGYFFQTKSYRKHVSYFAKGSNINNLKRDHITELEFPLAPLNEQRRIVEKIETLFAQLDKGEEAIRQTQKLLRTYRQSVLKAAVTGELTRDWREANKDKLEPASDILARILKTRRENWQGRGKYKEPQAPDTSDLPELPEGWIWASVDQVLRDGLSNGRSVPDAENGFPVMRLTALKDGLIDISERKLGDWDAASAEAFLVRKGDILVSRGNGSKKLVGSGGLVVSDVDDIAYPDTMIRVPIALNDVLPEWFIQFWNSPFLRSQIESAAKTTAGIYKINQGDIRSFLVPLPPIKEQYEISMLVSECVDKGRNLERWCDAEIKRSASLRQSVLKQAFSGKLVPQDPADEPASVLLERIRAECEANKPAPKRSCKKTAKRKIKA
ncbi:MAG: hypothetical protein CML99_11860 [Rhodobiaceae bacterium]|nr:hypothetical protein [Rhodobiaceae bacterium]